MPRVASESSVSAQVAASQARSGGKPRPTGPEPFAQLLPDAESAQAPPRRDAPHRMKLAKAESAQRSRDASPRDNAPASGKPATDKDGSEAAIDASPVLADTPAVDAPFPQAANPAAPATIIPAADPATIVEAAPPPVVALPDAPGTEKPLPAAVPPGPTPAEADGVSADGEQLALIASVTQRGPLKSTIPQADKPNIPTADAPAVDPAEAASKQTLAAEGDAKPPKTAVGHGGPEPASPAKPNPQTEIRSGAPASAGAEMRAPDIRAPAPTFDPGTAAIQSAPPAHGPAHAGPAPAPSPAQMPVPLNGLAVEIAANAQGGRNRFEIRLDPPELGRIDVRLRIDSNGQVTSHLIVDRAETLDLLRRDAADLERSLQQAGLKTSDNGLQFSLRDQSPGTGGDQGDRGLAAQLIVPDSEPATEITMRGYLRAGQGAGVDIRV